MYTIFENSSYEIVIKNSRFICCLFEINSKDDVNNIINDVKTKYKDATHYCYAYVIGGYQKSSDDGEPGGTAGLPILNVLISNKLNNVIAIVVRYFGGTLLGAGGLVRAYSKSVSDTIKRNKLVKLINGINFDIYFDYNKSKEIDYILKDEIILIKEYNNQVHYNINSTEEVLDKLKDKVISYNVNNYIYIKDSHC
ncbi:MAG: YigZ family protein [Bacilli bacterium]|nr:YigZ family protein [Bacilli bacterium]